MTTIIDGKKIADEIKEELKKEVGKIKRKLRLAIVFVDEGKYLPFVMAKKKFGEEIGINVMVYKISPKIDTANFRSKLSKICKARSNHGVILQLPLPKHIQSQYVLNSILPKKDVDVLSSRSFGNFVTGRSGILPPVVGATKEIFDRNNIELKGKNIVVVGSGMLVGKPAVNWLMDQGATVSVINEFTLNPERYTLNADIIISGAGVPGLIKKDMVKEGVITIDAGFPKGDFDPTVADKTSLFTSVPNGIGPITVAMVFRNLIKLAK